MYSTTFFAVSGMMLAAACGDAAAVEDATPSGDELFTRIASFPVFKDADASVTTAAEIIAATPDGKTLVFADSLTGNVGFVDITDPRDPKPGGVVAVGGEPTSITVRGRHALVVINTSEDYVRVSGELKVIDVDSREVVRTINLGGQPDSVAVSPDGRYAAIAIENERDERLAGGAPPQAPAGFLVIVDLVGEPDAWTTRSVDLVGIAERFPGDPEPEYVDVNALNVAAVTLQENNHVVLVDLPSGAVVADFSAGEVVLDGIDMADDGLIDQTGSGGAVPREPDSITWLSPFTLATADEGDYVGASRSFTIWSPYGTTLFEAGNTVEHAVARIGHYPDSRSGSKGAEPEGVEYGEFGDARYLFVSCERSSVVLVYRLRGPLGFAEQNPELVQILPTGVGPEGLLALPNRNLLVVASEVDDRAHHIRATIMIYERRGTGNYPDIESVDRGATGAPIPWGGLSALAVSPVSDDVLYSVHDSSYRDACVYEIDRRAMPARIVRQLPLVDSAALLAEGGVEVLDLEGLTVEPNGTTFWVVSEGSGKLKDGESDPKDKPFKTPNLLLRLETNAAGTALEVTRVVGLPAELASQQSHAGLEGVAIGSDGALYVCFQRAWKRAGDPSRTARIGRFDPETGAWGFALYPIEKPTSSNGGRVGLSEIAHVEGGRFAVLERDDQGGTDATIKHVYSIDVSSVTFRPTTEELDTFAKSLDVDIIAAGVFDALALPPLEKLEGMAILSNGDLLIVNDNDGTDGSSGETRLLMLPGVFPR